jgi:hypothetical protein
LSSETFFVCKQLKLAQAELVCSTCGWRRIS